MSNKIVLCLLVIYMLVVGNPTQAAERYVFDRSKTSISFSVSRFGIFETDGKFNDYDGDFVFCIPHPDEDSISITLYTTGIDTSDDDTDKELRGPDFFNAAQFPSMRFVSTSIKLIDQDHAKIIGNLTLLGVTKLITFDAQFTEKDYDEDIGEYAVSFTASTVIKRSDFGMDHLIPIIGDEVHLDIQVTGVEEE